MGMISWDIYLTYLTEVPCELNELSEGAGNFKEIYNPQSIVSIGKYMIKYCKYMVKL